MESHLLHVLLRDQLMTPEQVTSAEEVHEKAKSLQIAEEVDFVLNISHIYYCTPQGQEPCFNSTAELNISKRSKTLNENDKQDSWGFSFWCNG